MFLDIDQRPGMRPAIIDGEGNRLTYQDLVSFSDDFLTAIGKKRCLITILCENCAAALSGYVASLSNRIVPLLLADNLKPDVLQNMIDTYHPAFLWVPERLAEDYSCYPAVFSDFGYVLLNTGLEPWPLYEELSLLLPTSGSTGSPKLVRHSYQNVISNAEAVAEAFGWSGDSVGMESLPINFTQGLNVATSILYAGGTVLLTKSVLTEKSFWSFMKDEHAQSFTGVPFSYEILNRIRFFRMDLPDLQIINQGGGRLPDQLFQKCAEYAATTGRKFIATYGSTETTSRMTFLPPELAMAKTGSIGKPFPGRRIELIGDDDTVIDRPGEIGEIVYYGPNVTLGYAVSGEDLFLGDERNGRYQTGDLAFFDEDGCYYITGRKNRFLKIYGFRVGLDEAERLITGKVGITCACAGNDKQLKVYVETDGKEEEILEVLQDNLHLPKTAFCVVLLDKIPKNASGKTLYAALE